MDFLRRKFTEKVHKRLSLSDSNQKPLMSSTTPKNGTEYLSDEMREEECCICLGHLSERSTMNLECGHSLHSSCGVSWYRRNIDLICPLCRKQALTLIEDVMVS